MTNAYIVSGTLKSAGTIFLNEPLPVNEGEVRVTVEVVGPPRAKTPFLEVMEKIWAAQRARGHMPPTAEEVAERVREAQQGWEK